MTRLDLAFILCCCKACLGSPDKDQESFYDLLGVEHDATTDDLKRAYKRKSLQMHPDKLAQKGQTVTDEDQAKFTRMKEAYEVLSDPHKRETYDAIGERGMKWTEEPFSMDPQEMAHNFATSSTIDRAKIFSIFLFVAIAIFIQPILICLQIDGKFGDARWTSVLIPLWIWSILILVYHCRILMMGKIPKPDHIPDAEWEDPLPMPKRIIGLIRFILFFAFELQTALHLDGVNSYPWSYVLGPLFLLEAFYLFKMLPLSRMVVETIEEIEFAMGKPFAEFTEAEKLFIGKNYVVVPDRTGEDFYDAQRQLTSARQEVMKIILRMIFMGLLIWKLDGDLDWSWWAMFIPFYMTSICICWGDCRDHAEVQASAEEKLYQRTTSASGGEVTTDYGAMEEGGAGKEQATPTPLTEEEMKEIKDQVVRSSSRLFSSCCSQMFFLILLCLGVGKIQGAGYTTFWLISPFLFSASVILCLLGCTIFCVAPIDEDDVIFDRADGPTGNYFNMATSTAPMAQAAMPTATAPTTMQTQNVFTPPPPVETRVADASKAVEEPKKGHLTETPVPSDEEKVTTVEAKVEKPAAATAIDLLDTEPQSQPSDESRDVVPTPSEVDDLD